MRKGGAILLLLITVLIVLVLDGSLGLPLPALGRLLDPVNGSWASAEPADFNFNNSLNFRSLKHPVTVWIDNRMVPHIHAEDDTDLYFIQGYIHAYFRLWQMDMEARAAAGRISEVAGPKALLYDRKQRRKGMVYGAENSLKAIEDDQYTKVMADAYTEGVNEYIATLDYRALPLEYKLMGFKPENWTNLKSALLLKYMADDLTGYTEDIPLTFLRDILPADDFNMLFPEKIKGSTPVIPQGTHFDAPSLATPQAPADSIWTHFTSADFEDEKKDEGKGSNNWAVSSARTQKHAAILCNDPHLGLNLPSLWFEVQLQSANMNVYGVSLPGAPGVIIGFNDSLAWGFTNNYRDVKDFYAIKPVDGENGKYWFDGQKKDYSYRVERIAIKGEKDFVDSVKYTIHGPVIYDEKFRGPRGLKKPLALCWMGHKGTNELKAVYMLNKARGYNEFVDAIMNFQCPAQNMICADKAGNIAIWGQGQFVDKWKEQGRFVMDGSTSKTLWGTPIPMRENPHALNPAQGYLSSANQSVTDSTYPYWYNGYFYEFRAWRINQALSAMPQATVQDMFNLQNDTYSILAATTLPIMLRYLPADLPGDEKVYMDSLTRWDYRLTYNSTTATIYQKWWDRLYADIWSDDFASVPDNLWPSPERTMQLMQTDTGLKYYDDKRTPQVEHLGDMVQRSFKEATDSMKQWKKKGGEWYKVKNTTVEHLAKLSAFSFDHLKIGGSSNTVNAAKHDHGPSWRMVVQMSKDIEAYGVYPGGQSGNPGSQYYADFLPKWTNGQYYRLLFLPNVLMQDIKNKNIKYTWAIQP